MQQMTNVLLTSPDSSRKVADSQSKSIEPKSRPQDESQGRHFSAALEEASGSAIDKKPTDKQSHTIEAEQNAALQDNKSQSSNKEGESPAESVNDNGDMASRVLDESLNKPTSENGAASDDVSQIFAQINLANNFGGESTLAVNGESLPMTTQMESESLMQETSSEDLSLEQLSDEALMALGLQSGLSEQELSQLSSVQLKALLQQEQMLDANGSLKAQFGAASQLPLSAAATGNNEAKTEVIGDKSAINPTVTDPKSVNVVDIKGTHTGRDIFGKEVSGLVANQVNGEQAKAAQSADAAHSNATNMATSVEQLKGAELSVRMTATQAGLETNLTGMNDSGSQELKALSGLQSQPLHQQPSLSRQELPQFNLSLKPVGEQAPQMQQMIQRFSPVMNQQLITMVSKGIQQAEIRLDPPELGQMMVRIQVQGDTTQVQFQVSQHQTRDLVEQAMPRLREMLAEQGMQLTDGQVSHGDGGNGQGERGLDSGSGHGDAETDEISAEEMLTRSNLSTSSASGIDYYA